MTGTSGTAEINTNYPNTEGLEAETTKLHGRKFRLEPTEQSLVPDRRKEGL